MIPEKWHWKRDLRDKPVTVHAFAAMYLVTGDLTLDHVVVMLGTWQVGQKDIVLTCNYHFDRHEAEQLEVKALHSVPNLALLNALHCTALHCTALH
jgi:hypothetical protein